MLYILLLNILLAQCNSCTEDIFTYVIYSAIIHNLCCCSCMFVHIKNFHYGMQVHAGLIEAKCDTHVHVQRHLEPFYYLYIYQAH